MRDKFRPALRRTMGVSREPLAPAEQLLRSRIRAHGLSDLCPQLADGRGGRHVPQHRPILGAERHDLEV